MIPQFEVLGPLVQRLHQEFVNIYYMMLPVFFALAVVIEWAKTGGSDSGFLHIIKRAVICTFLLVAFKDICAVIVGISDGIAQKIDDMSGLNAFMQMASERTHNYSFSAKDLVLQFDDFFITALAFCSYLALLVCRYLGIAMYYFFWISLSIMAPLLLLFGLFRGTIQIPMNLFRSMCEVASWKIVWSILSAMMAALSFGDNYIQGTYITLTVMNFVIAIAFLFTPLIVKSIVGSGLASMAPMLGAAVGATLLEIPNVAMSTARSREILSNQVMPPASFPPPPQSPLRGPMPPPPTSPTPSPVNPPIRLDDYRRKKYED